MPLYQQNQTQKTPELLLFDLCFDIKRTNREINEVQVYISNFISKQLNIETMTKLKSGDQNIFEVYADQNQYQLMNKLQSINNQQLMKVKQTLLTNLIGIHNDTSCNAGDQNIAQEPNSTLHNPSVSNEIFSLQEITDSSFDQNEENQNEFKISNFPPPGLKKQNNKNQCLINDKVQSQISFQNNNQFQSNQQKYLIHSLNKLSLNDYPINDQQLDLNFTSSAQTNVPYQFSQQSTYKQSRQSFNYKIPSLQTIQENQNHPLQDNLSQLQVYSKSQLSDQLIYRKNLNHLQSNQYHQLSQQQIIQQPQTQQFNKYQKCNRKNVNIEDNKVQQNQLSQQNLCQDQNQQQKFENYQKIHQNKDQQQQINQKQQQIKFQLALNKKQESPKSSKILFIKDFNQIDQVTPNNFYNLFSNFGNILLIILKKSQKTIYLQFENENYASLSRDYLNNLSFYGTIMNINFSQHDWIKTDANYSTDQNIAFQFYIQKHHRFNCKKQISINYPSKTCHISNLEAQLTEEQLLNRIEKYGRCKKIDIVEWKNNKKMCFVKMSTLDESLQVVSNLHNQYLLKNQIKISFTNTKI